MSDSTAFLTEMMDSAQVSFGPFPRFSAALGSCAPLMAFDPHARYHGHSRSNSTVVLQDARSPLLPLTRRESPYYWVLSLTRSPKSKPIMRSRARQPVARDSNNRSLIQPGFSAGFFRRSRIRLLISFF